MSSAPLAPHTPADIGPPILRVTMGAHQLIAIRVPLFSLTSHENEQGEGFGVLSLANLNGMALYFEHDATSLRDLAAACTACADKLDGGKGKQ